jgi:hypothetical protein
MSEAAQLAKAAREQLAAALNALQSNAHVPAELLDVAEPIAQAMGVLHRVERSNGQNLEGRDGALENVRQALQQIQKVSAHHPAIDVVMEAVATSLGKVHALARYTPPIQAPAVRSPSSPPRPAAIPSDVVPKASPMAASAPAPQPAQPIVPSRVSGGTLPIQPNPFGSAGFPSPAAPRPQPAPQPAPQFQPQPAPQYQQQAAPQFQPQPAPQYQPQPAQPQQPYANIPPPPNFGAPSATLPIPDQRAQNPYGEQPQAAPQPWAPPPQQQPAPAGYAAQQVVQARPTPAPVQPAQPVAQARPTPAPAQPSAPPVAGRIDVELGTHSPSNFYKGLGGNDVIEHGGIFIATYKKVPKIGTPVSLRVLMPGDYEFSASGVVQWTREGGGDSAEPGFGARLTQITPEGRQLVYRYTRNREPMFYDDL